MYSEFNSPTLNNIIFSANSALYGGGMYSRSGNPIITNVTFSSNSASYYGGGLDVDFGNASMENVTFSTNTATNRGGGMYNNSSYPTLTNVTFSANSAPNGGGMYNNSSDPILTNATFSGNLASNSGSAMYNIFSSPTIRNSIFWDSTENPPFYNQFMGSTVSDSVIKGGCPADSTCTNVIGTDPKLGALGYYGGLTQTIPLQAGSSALYGAHSNCPAADQRGVIRSLAPGRCDIGAYEYETHLYPPAGPVAGGTTVSIISTDVSGAVGITFDGVPGSAFTVVSATEITADAPAHTAGAVDVAVPGSSLPPFTNGFTYYEIPTISGVAPALGSIYGGTAVVIAGTNLAGSTVTFGGETAACTLDDATQLTCATPAHAAGAVDVEVTSPGGAATSVNGYRFYESPVIDFLTPAGGSIGAGISTVLTGSGFTGMTSVTFDGAAASCSVTNNSHINCTIPLHAAGAVDVVVTTPDGVATSTNGFRYYDYPTVSGISIASGPNTGGTGVSVSGTNLTGFTSVTFGGTSASCSLANDSQLNCNRPAHATGTASVVVTTPGGSATSPVDFTYYGPPTVETIVPNSGLVAGGTSVVITGTNLDSATVTFDGLSATGCATSATQMTCSTPAHPATGAVNVVVTGLHGTVTAANGFAYFTNTYGLTVSGAYSYLKNDAAMPIGTGLTASSNPAGGSINGAVVVIGTGFQVGDTLDATTSGGVTKSYGAASGVLTLTGAADVSVYQTILSSVTFSSTSSDTTPRKITYSLGTSVPYSLTGHFFEYVPGTMSWTAAKAAAAARTYFGSTGYLATINDAGENAFANTKISGQGAWIGGSDAALEGNWKWVTGPEAGNTFCAGRSPCVLKPGWYMGWDPSGNTEPNNYGSGENYTQFVSGGTGYWNDLSGASGGGAGQYSVSGYVVEYGGMPGDNPMPIQGSVTVNVRSLSGQSTPTIDWSNPADIVYGTQLTATELNAAASGSLPGAYAYTPAATTILNVGAHTLHVVFTPTDTTNYTKGAQDVAVNVTKVTPTITFGAAPTPTYLGGNFTVSATTTNTDISSPTFSVQSGPCAVVSGATFRSTGAGLCVVQADDPATINFNPATQVQNVTMGKAIPTLYIANSRFVFSGLPQAATVTAGVVTGTVSNVQYNGSPTVPTDAGSYPITADFTPDNTAN
jgi:hypothetical protein